MLFDYFFIIGLLVEWVSVLLLFLLKSKLLTVKQQNTSKSNLALSLVTIAFGLVIIFKLLHVLLFVFQFNHKSIAPSLLLPITIYVLWHLILSAFFFYLLMKFTFKNHFQDRFVNALSKRIFAKMVFLAVWDMAGSLLIYLVLTGRLWLSQLKPYSLSFPFKEPLGEIPLLMVGLGLIIVSIVSFFKIKKEITRFNLIFYSLSFLGLILFSFFTLLNYRFLIFPYFENFFNQFYLFLAVASWLIIFLLSVILFSLMIQLYVNKKYLKSGFQLQFLFYNLSRAHLLGETGMTLIVLIVVFFFIYF